MPWTAASPAGARWRRPWAGNSIRWPTSSHSAWRPRLARYNVTAESLSGAEGKVKYFEGTPIPTSVVIVGLLAIAAFGGRIDGALWFGAIALGPWTLHPLVLVYALSGSLMISKTLHIPKP